MMLARLQQSDEVDTGPHSARPATERLCVATRTVKPIADMIRFVVGPDGAVVPDLKRKLPGRGIWITATRQALADAVKRKTIRAAFKRDLKVDAELVATTERLMERAVVDALAICGKAALAVAGFAKVETALAREPVVALLHAAEAAPDGVRKLDSALQRLRDDPDRVRIVTDLTSDQLDLALARPNVIHAALLAGSASDTFLERHARLTRYRTGIEPGAAQRRGRTGKAEDQERND
jgi:predicted RNA-binding protein YlxR (DUF448 family)